MDPRLLSNAERLFAELVELPAGARRDAARARCEGDPGLLALVLSLLTSDEQAGGFMQQPATPRAGSEDATSVGSAELAIERDGDGSPAWSVAGGVADHPARVGPYEVVRLIGEGGMGSVYEAWQVNPRRTVALKVMRAALPSREMLARFRREAQVLGRLRHPGIAAIYEAGAARIRYAFGASAEYPFIAMELVRGRTLAEHARARAQEASSPAVRREMLDLIARICDAVEHAHTHGVVHRDLKPSNVIIDESGAPKVLDFGVARTLEPGDGAGETSTGPHTGATTLATEQGRIIGTLSYMSPEQVEADPTKIDRRTDVYALGVMLYELLAGRPPLSLHDASLANAARIIREEEPSRLGSIHTSLRGDVETIVAKAIEKDPLRRYQSAGELAADIRKHLRDEPISARPAGTFYQLAKFARRNRSLVGGVAATIVALIAGLVGMSVLAVKEQRQRHAAEDSALRAQRLAYRASLSAAQSSLRAGDLAPAMLALAEAPERLRGWEWRHLLLAGRADSSVIAPPAVEGSLIYRGLSPDGSLLAATTGSGTLVVQRTLDGETTALTSAPDDQTVQLSTDGTRIAFRSRDGRVQMWSTRDARALWATPERFSAYPPGINRDGTLVAAAVGDLGRVAILSGETGRVLYELGAPSSIPTPLFSRDSTLLAVSSHSEPQTTTLIDLRERRERWRAAGVAHAMDASGSRLCVVRHVPQGAVGVVLDTSDGRELGTFPLAAVNMWSSPLVAFRPDGAVIAAEDTPGLIGFWDSLTFERMGSVTAPDKVARLHYTDDGASLIALSAQHAIRFAGVVPAASWSTPTLQTPAIASAISRDGGRVCRVDWGCASVWDAMTGELLWRRSIGTRFLYAAAFSPDGSLLAIDGGPGAITVLDAASGSTISTGAVAPARPDVTSLEWLSDTELVVGCSDGSLWTCLARSPGESARAVASLSSAVTSLAVAPDGLTFAVASDGTAKRNRDTAPFVSASPDWSLHLWRRGDGSEAPTLLAAVPMKQPVCSLVFVGSTLGAGLADGTVGLVDVDNPQAAIRHLRGGGSRVDALAASPDGSRLVGVCKGGASVIWDTGSGEPLVSLPIDQGLDAPAARFSSDSGALVISHAQAITVFASRAPDGAAASRREFAGRLRSVLDPLLARHRTAAAALLALHTDPGLPGDVRRGASDLLRRAADHPAILNGAAWGKVAGPRGSAEAYAQGLLWASAASDALPDHVGILNTLAVAQLRAGEPGRSLETFARIAAIRAKANDSPDAADLAVAAMAAWQTGDARGARAYLERSRSQSDPSSGPVDAETAGFISEAAAMIEAAK